MPEKRCGFRFGNSYVEELAYILFATFESHQTAAVLSAANHAVQFGRDVLAKHSVHAADVGF